MPQIHDYKKVVQASKEYFGGDELAAKVFADKYALRTDNKELLELTPADMFRRVARELARIEAAKFHEPLTEDQIFGFMDHFKYIIPQGGCLYGIGNTNQFVTLSNCYVVDPPLDSYGAIHHTDEQITQISKRRGGTGTNLNNLRPFGFPTRNSSRSSTGPISFAERYSHSIREVGQDGRRGALMLMLSILHPNVADFIKSKLDLEKITGANISVQISDSFMEAVLSDDIYVQQWPVQGVPVVTQPVKAKSIWDLIIHHAWKSGEPGVLFWDTILRESVADCYADFGFKTVATNPCSELPLCALDSCRLLLLNLYNFVVNPFTPDAYFDYKLFYEMAQMAQRLMDDIIDLELECIDRIITKIMQDPEPFQYKQREIDLWTEVRKKCFNGRRTGTGITGLGDTLAALGIKYGSPESKQAVDTIFKTLKFGVYQSSVNMAKELGPFPLYDEAKGWELEKNNPFLNRIEQERLTINGVEILGSDLISQMRTHGRRNIACLTCAPAGTMGIECQGTSGFEPLLFIKSKRRKKGNIHDDGFRVDFIDQTGDLWMEFEVFHPKVQEWMRITGETDITKSPWYGCCAEDLNYSDRVEMQGIAQKHIDHAISSTINLPEDISEAEVAKVYELAWRVGCKGLTVYRKNSRTGVILEDDPLDKDKTPVKMKKRPKELPCDVHHIKVHGDEYFVLVGLFDGVPHEVFAGKNGFIPKKIKTGKIIRRKSGLYAAKFDDAPDIIVEPITSNCTEMEEIISRLISLSLRSGAEMHRVVQQIEKVGEQQENLYSFCRSMARALKKYIPDGADEGVKCPECHQGSLVRKDGCVMCTSCGWSRCL